MCLPRPVPASTALYSSHLDENELLAPPREDCLLRPMAALILISMHQQPNNRLEGQTCLVTGASSGIGRDIAFSMAKEGANVVINYHANQKAADEVAERIRKMETGAESMVCCADVSSEKAVGRMFRAALEKFGTIDILVANAGIQLDAVFHEMTLEQWQRVIDVNLTGQFLCVREAIREFLRRGPRPEVSHALGKIIQISSVHQIIPWAGHANYAASKGGINLLMRSLAQGYGNKHIRVNSIAPGAIQTSINRQAWETQEALDKLLTLIPYDRIGQPSDIGTVAAWLASDESDYITGATIFVDGGMTCYPGFTTNG